MTSTSTAGALARRAIPALIPCAALLCSRTARAADAAAEDPVPRLPSFLRLEYVRGSLQGCPEHEVLEDAVISTAHRDPFNAFAPAVLRVALGRRGTFYAATIEVRDADGAVIWRRPFEQAAPSACASLVQNVGFLIGDQLREIPPASPANADRPRPAPAKIDPTGPILVEGEPPPPPPPEPVRLNLGIAGALALRTEAPVVAFNLTLAAGLRRSFLSGALELRWTPPQIVDADATGRMWISVQEVSQGIVPCGHLQALFLCGVGQVVEVIAEAAPGIMPSSITSVSGALGARIGGDVPIPWGAKRFAVRLSAEVLGALHKAAFHLDNDALTWRTSPVVIALGMGFLTDLRLK